MPSRRVLLSLLVVSTAINAAALGVGGWLLLAEPAPAAPQAPPQANAGQQKPPEPTPEERMARRFPQPVRVGDLIGQAVLDDADRVLGRVQQVVRTPDDKIQLIIGYGGLFGLGRRLVPVPVERVALLGLDIAAVDMPAEQFAHAPTWYGSNTRTLEPVEIIRLAVTRR